MMKTIFSSLLLVAMMIPAANMFSKKTDADGDKLIGIWTPSDGRSKIKIEKIGSKYYGKIVWLKEPNDPQTSKPKLDKNNPDTAMRKTPLKGYRVFKDFNYKGNKEWSDGTVYDPKNGKTYSCVINMKDDNTIDIRGYVGIKTFGRTDTWKRTTL
ncbi:MAG TPA: DUF2147 domain-containing protein [Bacteroidia bacterium]